MNSSVYESIMAGLTEAVEDAKSSEKVLKRRIVTILPVKVYTSEDIKKIRRKTGMSQRVFAGYMGVSVKTVESWESGVNHPSGAASRILNMMEMDEQFVERYPFVYCETNSKDV